jgi:hypothetical protein
MRSYTSSPISGVPLEKVGSSISSAALGRVVIPKEIRRTMRVREGDSDQTTLTQLDSCCAEMLELENGGI